MFRSRFFGIIVALLSFSLFAEARSLTAAAKRSDVDVQTKFLYKNCSAPQQDILRQAQNDAIDLAWAAIDEYWYGDRIDWTTEAAMDFWGPQDLNSNYRAYILQTFKRATKTRGYLGDWWYDRYVDIYCGGAECDPSTPGYNVGIKHRQGKYPEIHYCPVFFDVLKDHRDLVTAVYEDKSGNMKKNLRNLRSRATTRLHEWLHIKYGTAEVCIGGCIDVQQPLARVNKPAYKAGAAKLLASRSPKYASRNNDNYVYFAMARWMEKVFGTYPQYPARWDGDKSKEDNEKREQGEPGAPKTRQAWEMDDVQPAAVAETAPLTISDPVLPVAQYPAWYQPKIAAGPSTDLPLLSRPAASAIPWPSAKKPNSNDIGCETSMGSPLIEDCVNAFGALYRFPDTSAVHGKRDKTWWAGYVKSCAVAVLYHNDWTDSCNATYRDIQAHAALIIDACSNGEIGKVGGHIEYMNSACPAQIEIIHTEGRPGSGA